MGNKLTKSQANLTIGYTAKSREDLSTSNQNNTSGTAAVISPTTPTQNNSVGVLPLEPNAVLLAHLSSVVNIDLCTKDLISLSPNIALLTQATSLQACCNHLAVIPAEIGYMKNLSSLSLSRNELTVLPESIGFLTNLVELRLTSNKLRSLPNSIIALKKLHTISLEHNLFESLPAEISKLPSLVTLELSGNPLKVLPAEIMRMKYLRRLRLDNCPLAGAFSDPVLIFDPPSLKELSARVIVRNNWPIYPNIQQSIKNYLLSVQECSFCGGPYFENYVERGKFVAKNEYRIPIVFKLCTAHWNNEEQRVRSLFLAAPSTAPQYALTKSPSSGSLMNYFSYARSQGVSISRDSSQLTIPLAALAPSPSLPLLPNHSSGLRNRSASTLELANYDSQESTNIEPEPSLQNRPRSKSFSNLLKKFGR